MGYNLIPKIIINAYVVLYKYPVISIVYDPELIMLGLAVAIICIVGGAFYASYRKLRHVPATLMRPKAPKPGKRVLLERITILWKRLKFTQKVTLRNIFRYKKRFLMAIIGIAGATSLIIVGFGIKSSIAKIAPVQYGEIYKYDMQVGIKDITQEEKDNLINEITNKTQIDTNLNVNMQSLKLIKDEVSKDVQLMVINNEDNINDFITLRNSKSKEEYILDDNGIVITERVSKMLGLKQGDTILIENEDEIQKEVKISGITEHYISHYMYMTDNLYQELYDKPAETNILLLKTTGIEKDEENELGKEILGYDNVSSISVFSDTVPQLDKTMSMLDYVVVVLIVSAGLLTFIVLYNLSNVNISERLRELATLKVLGFHDEEVDQYVNREMIILVIIGMILGLFGGNLLTTFILETVEQEQVMFPHIIDWINYIYAMVIVVVFTVIVNLISHFALKKISMVESLKSIE